MKLKLLRKNAIIKILKGLFLKQINTALTAGILEGSPASSVFSLTVSAVINTTVIVIAPKTAPVALQACCRFNPAFWKTPARMGVEAAPRI